jgi:hypothetical protein
MARAIAPWVPGTERMANEIKMEKPETEPTEVASSGSQARRGGTQRSRNKTTGKQTRPAPANLKPTMSSGGMLKAAIRVAGTVMLNMITQSVANKAFMKHEIAPLHRPVQIQTW